MKNLIVLVVDDNLVSRLLPSLVLHPFSHLAQVIECETGEEALRVLASHHVTHVLLDISMPGLDGMQVAQLIREKSKLADVKLIAYTADVAMSNESSLKLMGFDGVLLKPPSGGDLLKVLGLS